MAPQLATTVSTGTTGFNNLDFSDNWSNDSEVNTFEQEEIYKRGLEARMKATVLMQKPIGLSTAAVGWFNSRSVEEPTVEEETKEESKIIQDEISSYVKKSKPSLSGRRNSGQSFREIKGTMELRRRASVVNTSHLQHQNQIDGHPSQNRRVSLPFNAAEIHRLTTNVDQQWNPGFRNLIKEYNDIKTALSQQHGSRLLKQYFQ